MRTLRQMVKARTTETTVTNTGGAWPAAASGTGVSLGRDRSLQQAVVYACIRLRAETIGALPVGVVRYDGPNRHPAPDPAWLARPNPETTRYELFERTSASIDADGNAFWYKVRNRLGAVAEVWVLPPSKVEIVRDQDPKSPTYLQKLFKVGTETYTQTDILHIPGFTLAGRLRGLSPIAEHAHAIGLAVAAETYGEAYFANGSQMTGVIESPQDPGQTNVERMRATFEKDHRGLRNAHRPGFLFGGAKWVQLSIPNDAAQFLETRKYQSVEIARIFRVPPHKIGDLERATFSNIEHQSIEWVQDGVLPYTTRIEHAVLADGLIDRGQRLRFNFAGLLRGDTKSMYEAFAIGRQWGWLNADDIRAFLDMNPLPDGKGETYLTPLNMAAAGETPELTTAQKIEAVGALVRAGFDPAEALKTVGLDPIEHLGLLPVTLQSTKQLELTPAEADAL